MGKPINKTWIGDLKLITQKEVRISLDFSHANEWNSLHEKYLTGNKEEKFAAIIGGVLAAAELLNRLGLNPMILRELEMQLLDKEMGSKTTFLDFNMPPSTGRKKAERPSRDLKATFAVGAIEAFKAAGKTEEDAITNVSKLSFYSYEKLENWHDYYFRGEPNGYSYLEFRLQELREVTADAASELGKNWAKASRGL